MLNKLLRLFHTIKYLKPLQGFYFFWRRIIGLRSVTINEAVGLTVNDLAIDFSHQDHQSLDESSRTFVFLNSKKTFPVDVQWDASDQNRLWRYNLHYFDYLKSKSVSDQYKSELIDSWIKSNPQGSEPAWEPYTASLRIVNWIKFFSTQAPKDLKKIWIASLYEQTVWLEKNLELHILANHYFENLRALFFAGAFFNGDEAKRWHNYAVREIYKQLQEQFLTDGGHYERSPQYHAIMMEVCLDMLNVVKASEQENLLELQEELETTIDAGMTFLRDIVGPDNQIPLLNDSAYDASPSLDELLGYAHSMALSVNQPSASPKSIVKGDSGIYVYKHNRDWFVIDCGDIGPSYQPGHTHCDFLSYELFLDGLPIIVDTGVFEYEPGAIRHYLRTTAAHNTVSINEAEQSEIWGEFRVARRAKKQFADVLYEPSSWQFTGAFTGFHSIGGADHKRTATLTLRDDHTISEIAISDEVNCHTANEIASHIHLHPEVKIAKQGGHFILTTERGDCITLEVDAGVEVTQSNTDYYPKFGVALKRVSLKCTQKSNINTRINYRLKRQL